MSNTLRGAIPVLHISNSTEAEDFYCNRLGFQRGFTYRSSEQADPCYMGVRRDGAEVHLSSFSDDGVAGGLVNFLSDDVDALRAEFVASGVAIAMEPTDQSWGSREMYIKDTDGNSLRFVCHAG